MTWTKRDGLYLPDDDQSGLCSITAAMLAGNAGFVDEILPPLSSSTLMAYWPCTSLYSSKIPDLAFIYNPGGAPAAYDMTVISGTMGADRSTVATGLQAHARSFTLNYGGGGSRLKLLGAMSMRCKLYIPSRFVDICGASGAALLYHYGESVGNEGNHAFGFFVPTTGGDSMKIQYNHATGGTPGVSHGTEHTFLSPAVLPADKWFTLGMSRVVNGGNVEPQFYLNGAAWGSAGSLPAPDAGSTASPWLFGVTTSTSLSFPGTGRQFCIDNVAMTAADHLAYYNAVMKGI